MRFLKEISSKIAPRFNALSRRIKSVFVIPHRDALAVFYDLGEYPASYDIVFLVVAAQARAIHRQIPKVHVYIVNGPVGGLRNEEADYAAAYPEAQRNYVVSHVMEVIPRLASFCERTAFRVDRDEALILTSQYAAYYSLWMENEWNPLNRVRREAHAAWQNLGSRIGFKAPEGARTLMRDWLKTRGITTSPIVLTIRDRKWSFGRNSNQGDWENLASTLRQRGIPAVVIPDTERVFEKPIDEYCGLPVCTPASVDTELRLALCELARMNFTVNTGPGTMLLFSRAPYRYFTNLDRTMESSGQLWTEIGLPPGAQLSQNPVHQKLIWEQDTSSTLLGELEAVLSSTSEEKLT